MIILELLKIGCSCSTYSSKSYFSAARITAKLTSWGKLRFSSDDLSGYLSWLKRQITASNAEWLTASTSALMIILRVEENRRVSWITQTWNLGKKIKNKISGRYWYGSSPTALGNSKSKYWRIPATISDHLLFLAHEFFMR